MIWTVQLPFAAVVHDADPLAPLLQTPVRTTPLTAPCVPLWTRIVTFAVQFLPEIDVAPSRSPMWNGFGGGPAVTVIETVARLLIADPSVVV